MSDVQEFGDEFQRASKDGFDAAVSSCDEVNKGLQAIAAEPYKPVERAAAKAGVPNRLRSA